MSKQDVDKRKTIIDCLANKLSGKSQGGILVGSMAYADEDHVTEKSDVDLIVVYDNIKDCVKTYFGGTPEEEYLENSSYDGYLVKKSMVIDGEKIAVSIHNLSYEALQRISYGNLETLAYYRQSHKDIVYYSKDFDGENHPFRTPAYPIDGIGGERRVDSIAMNFDGKYVIGNDMDKLMSGARVLFDTNGKVQQCIDNLWNNVSRRMVEHYVEKRTKFDPYSFNLAELLVRYERFSPEVIEDCRKKTLAGVCRAMNVAGFNRVPSIYDKDKIAVLLLDKHRHVK